MIIPMTERININMNALKPLGKEKPFRLGGLGGLIFGGGGFT
jgi:hypothetical protein